MVRLTRVFALVLLSVVPAGAQEPGVLAIDEEAGRYAFSFRGRAEALNMCGSTGCEVVATFSACLGLGYSSPTQGRNVWTWVEATTEGAARQGALNECERTGGPACEVLNVFCAEAPAVEASAAPDSTQENLFWQSIRDSTDPADFEAYLRRYPAGAFRALARNRLARLGAPASAAGPDAGDGPEAAPVGGDPLCSEQPRGVPCWMEVANRQGCYVWNPNPQRDETVTWTGGCRDGFAEGLGSLTWEYPGTQQVANGGRLRGGKMDGTWAVTEQRSDGRDPRTFEATFADGEPQGVESTGQNAALQEPQRPQTSPETPEPDPEPVPARVMFWTSINLNNYIRIEIDGDFIGRITYNWYDSLFGERDCSYVNAHPRLRANWVAHVTVELDPGVYSMNAVRYTGFPGDSTSTYWSDEITVEPGCTTYELALQEGID
ncbi:MAG: DUF4189 domain-containing protein [Acidobacteria bacterium]|nr:DUF4189 domain-containing protein [Acidobacteriota bacterium]